MIAKLIKAALGKTKTAAPAASIYAQNCQEACSTTDGAWQLAAALTAISEASTPPGERYTLALKQKSMANNAANRLRVLDELDTRIPLALDRNEKAAVDAQEAASADLTVAQADEVEAKEKYAAMQQRLEAAENSVTNTADAEIQKRDTARAALKAAQAAQDFDAIETAGDLLDQAERAFRAVEDSQRGLKLKIKAMQEVCEPLEAQLAAVKERRAQVEMALENAKTTEALVKIDRQVCAALREVAGVIPKAADHLPSRTSEIWFHLFVPEHRPFWKAGQNDTTVSVGVVSEIGKSLIEPDWTVFEVDPATLPDMAPQSTTPQGWESSLQSLAVAEINRRTSEEMQTVLPSNPNAPQARVILEGNAL